MVYTVNLTYFRRSGKYYSDGTYTTGLTDLWRIFEEVEDLRDRGELPGLLPGSRDFLVLIKVPNHPHDHPHLVV